jgi:hypothetical protein
MQSIGFAWRAATVSEIERSVRNVTIAEMLGLRIALDATVEQLIDPRGPERRGGPLLTISEQETGSGRAWTFRRAPRLRWCVRTWRKWGPSGTATTS